MILLTGATGYIGSLVLARLLEREGPDILCPVRASDDAHACERIDALLRTLWREPDARARVRVRERACDLAELELAPHELAGVTHVLHCAAAVGFDQPIGDARRANVDTTRAVLDLARRAPNLERVVHVSTAYVAGQTASVFAERDLFIGQRFRNSYEQSKLEAEQLVAARAHTLPIAVARPSIVVGEAGTGWTSSFNVLYPVLRAYSRGLIGTVCARPGALVDVVTGDYVADALMALLLDAERASGTYHLVAGEDALTVAAFNALAASTFDREPVELVDSDAPGSVVGAGLGDYFDVSCSFDARRSRAAIGPLGVEPVALGDAFGALVAYAERTAWGKRPAVREAAPVLVTG